MIKIVIFSQMAEEIQHIRHVLKAYSFQHSWADCQIESVADPRALEDLQHTVDILICDISGSGVLEQIKAWKAQYPPVRIFPIAGPDVPPTAYVCPEIMPCGLFWRPITPASAQPVVEQMMAVLHDQVIPPAHENFRIAGKQKIQDIPFASILFFEAREKKLALRMQEQELSFGGTLSKLEDELPPEFIRCHKSYIVNRRHILSVNRTSGTVMLDNQMELPISRSYKKAFWEVYQDDV